jgi:hypothetical protein
MKRDRIYELVLALVLISLGLGMGRFVTAAFVDVRNARVWFALIADVVAIFGVIWLFRDYLRRLRESIVAESHRLGVSVSVYEVAMRIKPAILLKKLSADDVDEVARVIKDSLKENSNAKLAKKG